MNENVWPMLLAMVVAIMNFWVALINIEFDTMKAKLFVSGNFVLGAMNLATAIKFLMK